MSRYWLGLGGNLGDPAATIRVAVDWLAERHEVEAVSRLYETSPRDLEDQPPFRNAAVRVRGKAWPAGDNEPAAWMIDKTDPIGNRQGAPGLFLDAQFGVYLDNFSITPNQ